MPDVLAAKPAIADEIGWPLSVPPAKGCRLTVEMVRVTVDTPEMSARVVARIVDRKCR